MPVFALHGAVTETSDDATAYGGLRTPHYVVDVSAVSADAEVFAADRTWVRLVWEALRPLSANAGSYVNFISELDDDERVRAAYGPAKYGRLAQIKAATTRATCSTATRTSSPPDHAVVHEARR